MLSKYIPPPNNGTEFDFNPITTSKEDQYLTRIDHTFGSRDAIWGSWYWRSSPSIDDLPFTGSTLPGFPETARRHTQEYVLTWNHTFSPTMLNEARLPYIVILTDPTTGGVSASYAMLGDVQIAEPGALIGFSGPRVIEQTIRERLPEGFQRAEYLLDHGMIDMIVHRQHLKETLARIIRLLMKQPAPQRGNGHANPRGNGQDKSAGPSSISP